MIDKNVFDLDSVGRNIKQARLENGLTREQFSELTGVSTKMVYNWEEGLNQPTLERFVLICHVLGKSMDSIAQ
jgi:transcriptional regulator with XRE-family HTH domain